jgi:hypothetical protein
VVSAKLSARQRSLLLALSLMCPGVAHAQEAASRAEVGSAASAPAAPTAAPALPAPVVAPVPELPAPKKPWWRHATPVPIALYSPETQFGFGAGLMATWQMPGAWVDRPSNVVGYGIYTTRAQTIVGATVELHLPEDRWVVWQDLRYIDWPDRFYGLGNATRTADRENYTDHYVQLESELLHRVVSRLYVGLRHHFRLSEVRDEEPDGQLANRPPLGVGRVLWSGVGAVVSWDTRRGVFWPEGGSLLRADATLYQPWLGADFSAQLLRLDLRHYQPLWLGHVLALRLVTSGAVGDVPFQLLPALGGANLFRGWYLGRLRDRVSTALELEYRLPLSPRWALVGFGSLGRVAARVRDLTPDGLKAAGGAGARFALTPEGRANFRLDVAYGDDLYVYFQFREAF